MTGYIILSFNFKFNYFVVFYLFFQHFLIANREQAKEKAHTFLDIAKGSRNKTLEPESLRFSNKTALQIGIYSYLYSFGISI